MSAGHESDQKGPILEIASWLQSPLGRYLLDWEQQCLDAAVVDLFGFHALQLGWPQLQGLRANRMPQRWLVAEQAGSAAALVSSFDELPFENASLDLIVMPHTLELAPDPHHRLREAHRVLRPEGRLLLLGLNPASLWALRQKVSPCLPARGEFIGYWRLRDWLRLLGFDIGQARFGCYRPPWNREAWLDGWAFMDRRGPTWWPVFGAVYFIEAIKRVHGMRLVGLAKSNGRRRAAPTVALPSRTHRND